MTQQERNAHDSDLCRNPEMPGNEQEQSADESAIDWVDRLNRMSYQRVLLNRMDSYFKRSQT